MRQNSAYQRGNMALRGGAGNGPAWGTREQRIEEGNRSLMVLNQIHALLLLFGCLTRWLPSLHPHVIHKEQENDAKWAELGDQVSLLKSVLLYFVVLYAYPHALLAYIHFSSAIIHLHFAISTSVKSRNKSGSRLSKSASGWHGTKKTPSCEVTVAPIRLSAYFSC